MTLQTDISSYRSLGHLVFDLCWLLWLLRFLGRQVQFHLGQHFSLLFQFLHEFVISPQDLSVLKGQIVLLLSNLY